MTTPNPDLVYAMSYLDLTKYGPLVVEAPPGVHGMFDDFFQRPIMGPTIGGKIWRDEHWVRHPCTVAAHTKNVTDSITTAWVSTQRQ